MWTWSENWMLIIEKLQVLGIPMKPKVVIKATLMPISQNTDRKTWLIIWKTNVILTQVKNPYQKAIMNNHLKSESKQFVSKDEPKTKVALKWATRFLAKH